MNPDPWVLLAHATAGVVAIGLFVGGCYQISVWFHSWERAKSEQLAQKRDLYRVAEYVGLHRERFCGCPNCGGSYGDQFLVPEVDDDVG